MKRVLQDVHCTGDSVFGKYQQSVFQENKQRNRPESEWVHVENTHEGIIDRELFQQVSWIINQKQGKTKYMALNINNRLTAEQKKMAENIFDIVIQKYQKDEAEKFINIIASNL